jgi:hypothetical protein
MTNVTNTICVSLVERMRNTEQMAGLSVLDHGIMVEEHFRDLRDHVRTGTPLRFAWKLPEWISDPRLWNRLPSAEVLERYQVYHDCGKPFCLTFGDDGRRHFPNHAQVSRETWLSLGECPEVGELIGMDMDVHLLKEGVPEFAKRPQAAALLLTGLAEVHANAGLFGGVDSTSFKIKYKHLDRRGKAILAQWA